MGADLILWGHALAALLFAAAALRLRDGGAAALPRPALAAALALTALWALAVAGIDARDVSARVLAGLRDVAWLATVSALLGRDRRRGGAVLALHAAAIAVTLLAAAIAVASVVLPQTPALMRALAETRLALRALGLLAGLILVSRLDAGGVRAVPARRLLAIALTLIWGGDLVLIVAGRAIGAWPGSLVAVRGVAVAVAALLVAGAAGRGERPLAVSRAAAARAVAIVALAAYAALVALLTSIADAYGGEQARLAQAAIVVGATAALLALVSTPWLRAWGKVMVAKHLFSHRYDYRAEWQRFSGTLAGTGDAMAPLAERVARAIADLTVSPGALLLTVAGPGLEGAAAVDLTLPAGLGDGAALAAHLGATGRIVELDAVRAGNAPDAEIAVVPPALLGLAEAWAIVPLLHHSRLVGAIVLARPPVDRALDWEDFDLLRVAGSQAAGALAEDAARRALAEAERFDEFNRRFAFILHDIKNLVSQLALVARNAERHADNPVFRADMIATLTESSERMQALLARLSPQGARHEPVRPLDAAALLAAARRRRRDSPIDVEAAPGLWLLADPVALEAVLDHLVQNAIDASAPGGRVTLAAAADGDAVLVMISDRGRGMSAGFVRDGLFRPFVSTKPGGFGLGAFEARQMVEAMGGRVDVASREGPDPEGGTRVTLRLPAALALEHAA